MLGNLLGMKDIRAAIRSILSADAAVLAAVTTGNSPDVIRIFPSVLPQGITLPSVVQNLISEGVGYHLQGDDGLMQARVQIDAWATTPDAAASLSNLVFERLSGYSGSAGFGSNSPQEIMTVQGVFHDQGRDDYDSTTKMYTRRRDFLFWYELR